MEIFLTSNTAHDFRKKLGETKNLYLKKKQKQKTLGTPRHVIMKHIHVYTNLLTMPTNVFYEFFFLELKNFANFDIKI